MSEEHAAFLNRPLLRQLAGEEIFASGEQYFALGRVRQIRTSKDRVSARVTGSRNYRVKLWRRRDEILFECDCEAGQEEMFCRHCVAAGLAWLARAGSQDPAAGADSPASRDARREEERARLAAHLGTLGPDRLSSLLLEATDYDEILRRRLLLEAIGIARPPGAGRRAPRSATPPDVAAYQQCLAEAIRPSGYVDFHSMPDYAQGIEEAIAPLAHLLSQGWPDEVIGLTEFTLLELDAASDRADTGDALLNRVYEELQRCHLEACRAARPEPRALAARLLEYEIDGGLGVFNNAAKTYADVLGPAGLSAWRRLLIQKWEALDRPSEAQAVPLLIDHRRFQVQALTERLADAGDTGDAALAVRRRRVGSVYDAVALAEWLQANGRPDDAIVSARHSLERFSGTQGCDVLRDFLITGYQQSDRHGEALPLAWDAFRRSATLERFRELKRIVLAVSAEKWPAWRERALAHVNTAGGDRSRAVELLIDEDLIDLAWAQAAEGGCRDDLRLFLAARQETTHPEEVLGIYQHKIDAALRLGGANAYREALELLERVRTVFTRQGRAAAYEGYVAELRASHRHRRAFLRLLDAAGNPKSV